MSSKQELINTIKTWVKLDNEIRSLKKEQTARNNEKKKLTQSLIEIMKTNEIDCVDIKDGQLCYLQQNVKKPITKKNLLSILSNIFLLFLSNLYLINFNLDFPKSIISEFIFFFIKFL